MAVILGVDYGDKRTGLARSDSSEFLASGIGYISVGGMKSTAEEVARIATENKCGAIVVGLPKNMDGSEGWRAETIRAFAQILGELVECEIILYDERLSTMQAHRMLSITDIKSKKRKQVIDTLSAQIILQNYLDSKKK